MQILSSTKLQCVIYCLVQKHRPYNFDHIECTLRSCNRTSWTVGIFINTSICWLFTFPLNVSHASSKTNTTSHILFLSSTEPAIQNFSTIPYTAPLHGRFLQNFCDIFSMTPMYVAKMLQMNTLCPVDNTSHNHWSSLNNNTQTSENVSAQMIQLMADLLCLSSPILREPIKDTPCVSMNKGQQLQRHQHARIPLFTDIWWVCFKYDPGLEIKGLTFKNS